MRRLMVQKQRREIHKESGEEKLGAWSIIYRLLPGPKEKGSDSEDSGKKTRQLTVTSE